MEKVREALMGEYEWWTDATVMILLALPQKLR